MISAHYGLASYVPGVPEQVYDMDMEDKIPGFVWTCNPCIHAIPIKNLSKVFGVVKDEQIQCRSGINTLNTKVDKLENSIEDRVNKQLKNTETVRIEIVTLLYINQSLHAKRPKTGMQRKHCY